MEEKCACGGLSTADMARAGKTPDYHGFRKVTCARCGREFYTDVNGQTMCIECEKKARR